MNFVIGLPYYGLEVEHWRAGSEGLRFDSSWRFIFFSFSHARDKTSFSNSPCREVYKDQCIGAKLLSLHTRFDNIY